MIGGQRATARWLFVVALLAAPSAGAAPPDPVPATRYDALIEGLQSADEGPRRRYAELALDGLIESYAVELGHGAGAHWRRATRDFMGRLERARAALRAGAPLEIAREGRHAVRLIVADEQVMVSVARPERQSEFEATLARALCDAEICGGGSAPALVGRDAGALHVPRGEWSLTDRAPPLYAQEDGLQCVFEDMRHLRLKQRACESLTRELRLLETALRAALRRGETIDWRALHVAAGADGGARAVPRVSYDGSGRYFELDVPLLAMAPAVLRGAIPWLQTRLRDHSAVYVIVTPERLAYRVAATDR